MIKVSNTKLVNLPNAVFAYSATIIQSPPTNWFHTQYGPSLGMRLMQKMAA